MNARAREHALRTSIVVFRCEASRDSRGCGRLEARIAADAREDLPACCGAEMRVVAAVPRVLAS